MTVTFQSSPLPLAALVAVLFSFTQSCLGQDMPGVLLYTDPPGSPDEMTVSLEFKRADEHGHLVNVQPINGRARRIMTPQIKGIVKFKDLNSLTVTESKAFQALKQDLDALEQLAVRFPAHSEKWANYQQGLAGIVNKIQSGFAIVGGEWMPIDEYMKRNSAPEKLAGELEFDGKIYKGIRLVAVEGTEVGIIHLGGAARLPISSLEQVAIDFLNDGKTPPPIDPGRVELSRLKEEFSQTLLVSESPSDQSSEATREITTRLREEAKASADMFRQKASEIKSQVELIASSADLRREMGTFHRFRVLQKLQGWSFASLRETYGENLYEILFSNGEFAVVACPYTEFLTSGSAKMFIVPVDKVEVKMLNGFVRDAIVYREADPTVMQDMAENLAKLREVDDLNNEAERIELEAEERIKKLQNIISSLDDALRDSLIRSDQRTLSLVSAYRVVDERYAVLRESLGKGDLSSMLQIAGMNPESELATTGSIDEFIKRLSAMEFEVSFDVKSNTSVCIFTCDQSALSDPEKSLANASEWIAQKKIDFKAASDQRVNLPLFQKETYLISQDRNETGSDFQKLLSNMIALSSKEPDLDLPTQKVFQYMREHASGRIKMLESE